MRDSLLMMGRLGMTESTLLGDRQFIFNRTTETIEKHEKNKLVFPNFTT